jgi:NADPH2:quinone reductase
VGVRRAVLPAAQLAHWGGANVIGTVRKHADLALMNTAAVAFSVALDEADPAGAVRSYAPDGVDRIIEVAFSDNVDFDAVVVRNEAVIAAYATRHERPDFPFWPMLFDNVVIRLLGSDDFTAETKEQAAADLTTAARDGALSISIGEPLPLDEIADAHDRVDAGERDRVLISLLN